MPSFKDSEGREWQLRITIPDMPRLREAGLNLSKVTRDPNTLDVLEEPESLGKILWTLCESQAVARGVDEQGFARGFDGPTIFAAYDAALVAVSDFCQRPAVAAAVRARLPLVTSEAEATAVREMERMLSGGLSNTQSSGADSPGSAPPG